MLRVLKLTALLLFCHTAFAGNNPDAASKYKTFGLVWGFLKYHHPDISKGKYDWDAEFVKQFDVIEGLQETDALNNFYKKWINTYGPIADVTPKTYGEEYFTKNEDYRWFDSSGFDAELKGLLVKIRNGKHNAGNYYVKIPKLTDLQDFSNEKGFKGFDLSKKSHRVLDFFSFWNVTEYWNLNKYMFDEDWLGVLDKSLPEFIAAANKTDFEKAKARLFHYIQDSHTWYMTDELKTEMIPANLAPFAVGGVNDSLVVISTPSKPLFEKTGIALGDVITAINGKPLKEVMYERLGQYMSYGNDNRLWSRAGWLVASKSEYEVYTVVGKDRIPRDIKVQHYASFEGQVQREDYPSAKMKLPDDVAYLWLGTATKADLKAFFKNNANKKGVILDMRNYPDKFGTADLAQYLYPEKKKFTYFMAPTTVPGIAEKENKAALSFISDPFWAGSKNKDYYKGKVILLVNSSTISQSEFFGLCVQASPNCITVGSPTAGVVANVVEFTMPDGSKIPYTGYQAFYPDGTAVFKSGLKIDIPVVQSVLHYNPNLIFEKAVEAINSK
jgi:C-terminal processing protease CtpA/Prc